MNWFDTPASARQPSLARERGRCKLWRWRPNGNRRGTATIFATPRAIPPRGADAGDQFSPRPSKCEMTKSYVAVEHVRWLAFAESDNRRGRTIGGRGLRGDSLGLVPGEQRAQQRVRAFEGDRVGRWLD